MGVYRYRSECLMSLGHLVRRSPISFLPQRFYSISISPEDEDADAERRRRRLERRLRDELPICALRSYPVPPPPRLPDWSSGKLCLKARDSTSKLVNKELDLHNRVQELIRASDPNAAFSIYCMLEDTEPTVFTCNAIIAAMYRDRRYNDSISKFKYFFLKLKYYPDIVSYNLIINAHCDQGHVEKALEVYQHILATAYFTPSLVTYRHLTKGLVQAGKIGDAVRLLREMLSKGQAADSMVYNNLIKGFLDLGDLDKANDFFDELKSRCTVYDGIVNATFMEYWFAKGNDKEAMKSYWSLLDKKFRMHPPTGNVLLQVFLKSSKKTEAWALFNKMLDNHTPPNILSVNSETVSIMVNECFKMGQFAEAIDTFKKVGSKPTSKPLKMDSLGYRNIVTRLCRQGMIKEAEMLLKETVVKIFPADAPSYRAMIDAHLKANRPGEAVEKLKNMKILNLRVVGWFGTRVLCELIKKGKVTESLEIFKGMGEMIPKPAPLMYSVMVKALCDAGARDEAKEIIGLIVKHKILVDFGLLSFIIKAFNEAGRFSGG